MQKRPALFKKLHYSKKTTENGKKLKFGPFIGKDAKAKDTKPSKDEHQEAGPSKKTHLAQIDAS